MIERFKYNVKESDLVRTAQLVSPKMTTVLLLLNYWIRNQHLAFWDRSNYLESVDGIALIIKDQLDAQTVVNGNTITITDLNNNVQNCDIEFICDTCGFIIKSLEKKDNIITMKIEHEKWLRI